jgi:DNA-binding FadR family transcriptional regulator
MISIPGRLRRTAEEHKAIADAILSRESEAAGRTMAQHALRVEQEVTVAIHGEEYLR